MHITLIYTQTSRCQPKVYCQPACELYTCPRIATESVLDREYVEGIPTWTVGYNLPRAKLAAITARGYHF